MVTASARVGARCRTDAVWIRCREVFPGAGWEVSGVSRKFARTAARPARPQVVPRPCRWGRHPESGRRLARSGVDRYGAVRTNPTSPPERQSDMTDAPDAEVIALAGKLFDAARAGDTATLAAAVDAGVSADLTNGSGDTLVMLAAYHGHAATVEALLQRGADPNRANDKGQTPLAGAVFKGSTDVVDALLAGGADPRAGVPSAVDAAAMFGKTELLARFEGR